VNQQIQREGVSVMSSGDIEMTIVTRGDIKMKVPEYHSFERKIELFPYSIYDNVEKRVIGNIFLSEDQADHLNKVMQHNGVYKQRYAFMVGWLG
jgi:hypothetical protein